MFAQLCSKAERKRTRIAVDYPPLVSRGAYLFDAGLVPLYREALELQRSLAASVLAAGDPETVVLVEHPPV